MNDRNRQDVEQRQVQPRRAYHKPTLQSGPVLGQVAATKVSVT
jgi:hypothetical protein